MALKQRLMTAIYLRYEDQWLLLKRQGSRVVEDGLYTGTAGGHFEENEMGDPFACVQRELNEDDGGEINGTDGPNVITVARFHPQKSIDRLRKTIRKTFISG